MKTRIIPHEKWLFTIISIILTSSLFHLDGQNGNLVPIDDSQSSFLNVYNQVFKSSDNDYRSTGDDIDKILFSSYGEQSIYWITSGDNIGSFVFPGEITGGLDKTIYSNYIWQNEDHLSIQYKSKTDKIAIFKSAVMVNDFSINWEVLAFNNLFSTYLSSLNFSIIDENDMINEGLDNSTKLLIIPAFSFKGEDGKFYIDQLFTEYPSLTDILNQYILSGGKIYTEGNAVYLLEKLGILEENTIDFSDMLYTDENGFVSVEAVGNHPINYSMDAVNNQLFSGNIPLVSSTDINVICQSSIDERSVIFEITNENTGDGQIICNLGIPAVANTSENGNHARQLQWALNAITYFFSYTIDITRHVTNELPEGIIAGDNAVSYDRIDTFNVHVTLRNLSVQEIDSITLTEDHRDYFHFVDLVSGGVSYTINGNEIVFSNITIPAKGEIEIIYRLKTPHPETGIHEDVDDYIDYDTYIAASIATLSYPVSQSVRSYTKTRAYADLLFSARIFADTDVNWKNFLGLEYQPFKVFMIMENKQRTSAEEVVYTQYIPKDVPFYWSDNSINIPILKTPGGKFVDILKGSNDQDSPDYDMDSDGDPDAWLDTASIYPKGYTIVEDEVYWANPWEQLRTGNDEIIFEDLDHDGNITTDTNGDGIYETEDTDDKMRVWKVTWEIGEVKGYQYYDPYCYYEIWVDPPDLVKLSAGVSYAYGLLDENVDGMFYPEADDIGSANLADTSWSYWMERDENENVIWKQLIYQRINNYMGYAYIDTLTEDYQMTTYDKCMGTTPVPHNEFIAVLSLGGEEIDMYNPTPKQSLYSKIDYETIFGEERVTPIRTTYTYWAPLPNPLQFEYLSNNFSIIDSLGDRLDYLPANGKAQVIFDVDATTEYTYYWIRNVGYDVDFNDPSLALDSIDELGDGVFGYFIYDIPKGMGGYRITLPKNEDGSYNLDSIILIDGEPFERWIDNPNTGNEIEIWEDPFEYHVYVPQLLIPPALDDDNFDGTDDWIDDRGDRFCSGTGFLHDAFMKGDGESYSGFPETPFIDDIYGQVDSGWYAGSDNTYGDDFFENLGKTHITIHANYVGRGREGSVEISKGGILVVEEIFGGSPWVIFSHTLSGYAKGVSIELESQAVPTAVKYGIDTVYVKHVIQDKNEPHYFNSSYDPYHLSFGYQESAVTTIVGGKDPCSLIQPAIETSSIIDPLKDGSTVVLIPQADTSNPDLSGYPRSVDGVFTEIRIELMNGTDDNWINVTLTPVLDAGLGSTTVEMQYVAYPRPLVPGSYDADGDYVHGDEIGSFNTGWRFNQPEGEVLVKMGSTLNLLQPSRRAYYIILLKIDESLEEGIYNVGFTLSGEKVHYDGTITGSVEYKVPDAYFSIVEKNNSGRVEEFKEMIIDQAGLDKLVVAPTSNLTFTGEVKWSLDDIMPEDFITTTNTFSVETQDGGEAIDLSAFSNFPEIDTTKIYILQKAVVNSSGSSENVNITTSEKLTYNYILFGDTTISEGPLQVTATGPNINVNKRIYSVNGKLITDTIMYESDKDFYLVVKIEINNSGNDVASQTEVNLLNGKFYKVLSDSLPESYTSNEGILNLPIGSVVPGETRVIDIHYKLDGSLDDLTDLMEVINSSTFSWKGTTIDASYNMADMNQLKLGIDDLVISSYAVSEPDNTGIVTITASIFNRGLNVSDIAVRIYPIIGEGIPELPLYQETIDSLTAYSSYDLNTTYVLPENENVRFYIKIDDDEVLHEVFELNNSHILKSGESITKIKEHLIDGKWIYIYPNPVDDLLNLSTQLPDKSEIENLKIIDLLGSDIYIIKDITKIENKGTIQVDVSGLSSGIYILRIYYKLEGGINSISYPVIKK